MTQSPSDKIPTSISLDALKELHKSATSETSAQSDGSSSYQTRIEQISADIVEEISVKFDDPMLPKLVILRLINQMMDWAMSNQNAAGEANDLSSFAGFTAMAAQLSAASFSMQNIFLGPEDFTHPLNESEQSDSDPA